MTSWLDGNVDAQAAHYAAAMGAIDSAMAEQPSQHFVSALLLMAVAQFFCERDGSLERACSFLTLAGHLSAFVPDIDPAVAFTASLLSKKAPTMRHGAKVTWPPSLAPIGRQGEKSTCFASCD